MTTFLGFPLLNGFRSKVPAGFYDAVKGHTGCDFALPAGTPISLPVSVKIRDVRQQNEMGLTLYVEDPLGRIFVFAHLTSVETHVGSTVPAQTVFAHSGNTGTATTGAHLHFEIIAQTPTAGLEFMTRSLGIFKGYNIDPADVIAEWQGLTWSLNATPLSDPIEAHAPVSPVFAPVPQWAGDNLAWLQAQGWITEDHAFNAPVTWAELASVLKKMKGL